MRRVAYHNLKALLSKYQNGSDLTEFSVKLDKDGGIVLSVKIHANTVSLALDVSDPKLLDSHKMGRAKESLGSNDEYLRVIQLGIESAFRQAWGRPLSLQFKQSTEIDGGVTFEEDLKIPATVRNNRDIAMEEA